jgi:meso-butanediol dehydrogenase/(S,S)-butanediol dehydrogenase/diacetyl reductase
VSPTRIASLGARGARVNSISPGVVATEMGAAELDGPNGNVMRAMVAGSGLGRVGTAEDVAAAVSFLLSRDAAFITGTDLLVDGGVVASIATARR